ncbi:hypothetical protein [Apibacter sp. HY039]|uniref:hypothetical protein n=1 Tax=Apibacter sp. HY039 TaxID=2501476 RepID=UPI000FEBB71C|nr:hypothetical protein [Apibacter sp. HY039]
MKINLFTPMLEEQNKIEEAFREFPTLFHTYHCTKTGIGREKIAKAMMSKPDSDLDILVGFTAVTGNENTMPEELKKGMPVEVTASSLYGFQGGLFENGKLRLTTSKTHLPCLSSLTSDRFITTTDIPVGTLINMEDYTFMYLKRPQDLIIRVISDFLPHESPIDFFEVIKDISFTPIIQLLEELR